MAINRQDSRHRIKRSTLTGVVPTVPVSSDFTDGTWLNTDIRAGEFFYNIPDQRLWIGTDTGSIEIPLVGGSANTIAQVLYAGNTLDTGQIIQGIEGTSFINLDDRFYTEHFTTGSTSFIELNDSGATYSSTISNTFDSSDNIFNGSIIINSGFNVQASDGLGMLVLDYFGTPGEVSLSTDAGNQSESYLYMNPTSTYVVGGNGGSISLSGDVSINVPSSNRLFARVGDTGLKVDGRYNAGGSEDIIKFINNAAQSFTTQNSLKPSIAIASKNSTINSAITNSVILGGELLTASASNTVYVPDLNIQSSKSIKSSNGGGRIDLDTYAQQNTVLITTDDADESESALYMDPTTMSLSTNGYVEKIELSSGKIQQEADTINIKAIGAGIVSFPATVGNLNLGAGAGDIYMASDIQMSSGKVIKSSNGGAAISLDMSGLANNIFIATDGIGMEASIEMTPSTFSINNSTGDIALSSAYNIQMSSSSVNINTRIFKAASIANATAATSTLASISMSNDQTLTIQVVLNAYCASPNRNLGITMMASFLKYGGTIYQTGTTNLIIKDGFGDGSTGTIDTDGTNVRIRITNGAGLTTNWNVSYDYLLTT